MSRHPLDSATAERLIDSAAGRTGAYPVPGAESLAGLLVAVAVLPADAPLPGEESAVAAFRTAAATPTPPRPKRLRLAKAAAAAIAVKALLAGGVAIGGYALASAAGVLPDSWPGAGGDQPSASPAVSPGTGSHSALAGSGQAGAAGSSRSASAGSGGGADTGAGAPAEGASPSGDVPPAPPMASGIAAPEDSTPLGLCRAYGNVADRGKAIESTAFQGLVSAAGGRERVESYCAGVLAQAKPSAAAKPSKAGGGNNGNGNSGNSGSGNNGNGNSGNGNSGNGNSGNGNGSGGSNGKSGNGANNGNSGNGNSGGGNSGGGNNGNNGNGGNGGSNGNNGNQQDKAKKR